MKLTNTLLAAILLALVALLAVEVRRDSAEAARRAAIVKRIDLLHAGHAGAMLGIEQSAATLKWSYTDKTAAIAAENKRFAEQATLILLGLAP